MLVDTIILYSALALCGALIALTVRQYDLYDKEPWKWLVVATLLGIGMMWCTGHVQKWAAYCVYEATESHLTNAMFALIAASVEELGKCCVVLLMALLTRRCFNEPMDGLIYGSFAGLGCALEESAWVMGFPDHFTLPPPSEIIRLCGHLVFGGISGAGLGLIRARPRGWLRTIALGYFCAVLLHFLWDCVAFTMHDRVRDRLPPLRWLNGASIVLMLTGLVLYRRIVSAAAAYGATLMDHEKCVVPRGAG